MWETLACTSPLSWARIDWGGFYVLSLKRHQVLSLYGHKQPELIGFERLSNEPLRTLSESSMPLPDFIELSGR